MSLHVSLQLVDVLEEINDLLDRGVITAEQFRGLLARGNQQEASKGRGGTRLLAGKRASAARVHKQVDNWKPAGDRPGKSDVGDAHAKMLRLEATLRKAEHEANVAMELHEMHERVRIETRGRVRLEMHEKVHLEMHERVRVEMHAGRAMNARGLQSIM